MRAVALSLLAVAGAATAARAAPQALVLPAGPLAADGERAFPLEIYLVDGAAPARPAALTATAARGQVIEAAAPAPDGGYRLRYRPPRVEAPVEETLTIEAGGARYRAALPLEPAGRLR